MEKELEEYGLTYRESDAPDRMPIGRGIYYGI